MKNLIEKQQQEKPFCHLGFNGFDEGEEAHFYEILGSVSAIFQRQPANFRTLSAGFLWALEGYSMTDILYALREYVRKYNEFPIPRQIIEMIEKIRSNEVSKIINEMTV